VHDDEAGLFAVAAGVEPARGDRWSRKHSNSRRALSGGRMMDRRSPSRGALTRLVRFLLPVVVVIAVAGCDPTPVAVGATTLPAACEPVRRLAFGARARRVRPLAAGRYDVDYRAKFGAYVGNWGGRSCTTLPARRRARARQQRLEDADQAGPRGDRCSTDPADRCVVWLRPSDPVSTGEPTVRQRSDRVDRSQHPNVQGVDWRDGSRSTRSGTAPTVSTTPPPGRQAYARR
jgi:hypothetical protein